MSRTIDAIRGFDPRSGGTTLESQSPQWHAHPRLSLLGGLEFGRRSPCQASRQVSCVLKLGVFASYEVFILEQPQVILTMKTSRTSFWQYQSCRVRRRAASTAPLVRTTHSLSLCLVWNTTATVSWYSCPHFVTLPELLAISSIARAEARHWTYSISRSGLVSDQQNMF